MSQVLNNDCWQHVVSFLANDPGTLFQILMANKTFFHIATPLLYHRIIGVVFERVCASRAEFFFQDLAVIYENLDSMAITTATATAAASTATTRCNPTKQTIDYMVLVQELPDFHPRFVSEDMHSLFLVHQGKILENYRFRFGHKIQKIEEWFPFPSDSLTPSMTRYSNLQELGLFENTGVGELIPQTTFDTVSKLITLHRQTFPGVLKKVYYEHCFGEPSFHFENDPTMMLLIRDLMDGDWSLEEFSFGYDSRQEKNLLKILKDPILPRRLKSVNIRLREDGVPPLEWNQPVAEFLSRCRTLDNICFQYCRPEMFTWAVEEQEQAALSKTDVIKDIHLLHEDTTLIEDVTVMATSLSRVQWKSITFEQDLGDYYFTPINFEMEEYELIWQAMLKGFGHCMESFRFSAMHNFVIDPKLFPPLSVQDSITFPKLLDLELECPRLGSIATLGFRKLKNFYGKFSMIENGLYPGEPWLDLRWMSSLETLRFVQTIQGDLPLDIKLFGSRTSRCGDCENEISLQEAAARQPCCYCGFNLETDDCFRFSDKKLPSLEMFHINADLIPKQDLDDILIASQSTLTWLTLPRISGPGALDLVILFQWLANSQHELNGVFPRLKRIHAGSTMNLDDQFQNQALVNLLTTLPKAEQFPVLQCFSLGSIRGSLNKNAFKELTEMIQEPLQVAAGGSLAKRATISLCVEADDDSEIEQWALWLSSIGMSEVQQASTVGASVGLEVFLDYSWRDGVSMRWIE